MCQYVNYQLPPHQGGNHFHLFKEKKVPALEPLKADVGGEFLLPRGDFRFRHLVVRGGENGGGDHRASTLKPICRR